MPLPRLGNSTGSSRASLTAEKGFAKNYASLSRYVAVGRTESQSIIVEKDAAAEKTATFSGSNLDLLSTSLSLSNQHNKLLGDLIELNKRRDEEDDSESYMRRLRGGVGRRVRQSASFRRTPAAPRAAPGATRERAPTITNTRMNLRPGQIEVGGRLYYDTSTGRFHDPANNNRMVSRQEATLRGASMPSAEQIENANRERVASRTTPAIEAPAGELRGVPNEPARPGVAQRADQAVGRALSSTAGKVAIGGLSIVAAIPLIYEAYEQIKNIPTDISREQYERQVVTIISRLFASGVALPYIGAVMGSLLGSAAFPGVGTMVGLVGGILGGTAAGYFLGDKAEDIAEKLVEHFYDKAQRQREDTQTSDEFNRRRIEQRNLPQEQRGLPEDIDELERMLENAVRASTRGSMLDRPRARALIPQIQRRIEEIKNKEQEQQQPLQNELITPSSFMNDESSVSDVLRNLYEFKQLTFEASTIVFEGDIVTENMFGQPTAQFVSASPALSGGGAGASAVLASFGGLSAFGSAAAAATAPPSGEAAPPQAPSGTGSAGGTAASPPPSTPGFFDPGRREQTGQDFNTELNAVASRLGVQANDILAVMRAETGGTLSPSIRNPSGATGLIQFMPATARGLGTTTDELAKMSQVEQLKYVESYFKSVGLPRGASAGMIYSYVFMPGRARRNPNELAVTGTPAYAQNSGLDVNGDGIISIDDLDNFLRGSRRGRPGAPVAASPQTGAAMGSSSTTAEAERMRRQSASRNTATSTAPTSSNAGGGQMAAASTEASGADVPLRYRLQQAVA